ncbi:A/G-specific adenine glycosylase [Aerosakkonema sp. BLCC-F183]|uniref:A/G-specific adenine glycosylase n=1 Tax=Aerosakkonema sp. BLCC-F183 TaxID=3342834 RepID=UPI0035BA3B7D
MIDNQLPISKLRWFRRQLKAWACGHLRNFPWRRTKDPYAILVAEFLLQKTNADTVAPVYQRFMERYPTLNALAAAREEDVTMLLQPLGLRFRADRLRQSTQLILKNYQGKIPKTEAQLLKLPGVGKYTARSICAHAFGQRKAVLDTNVARIFERFFGLSGGRVKWRSQELQSAVEQVAPATNVGMWNLTLLDFGAAVCTARQPRCGECPLQEQCQYARESNINEKIINKPIYM